MIWQHEAAFNEYLGGSNTKAEWKPRISYDPKLPDSQYLMSVKSARIAAPSSLSFRLGFRAVQNSLNKRTMIANLIPACPCGNSVATLQTSSLEKNLYLLAFLCSFPIDTVLRSRMSQANVNWFYVEELATPIIKSVPEQARRELITKAAGLNTTLSSAWPCWLKLAQTFPDLKNKKMRSKIAITEYERLRLRCIIDAVVSELCELTFDEFSWLMQDCEYPSEKVCDNAFARTFSPKGFWRVDKEKDPELRHTVLSLIAFHDLKRLGLDTFLNLNDGEGWMLPETLRLADYGLGHDDRAKEPQPVAARLGPRFLPWQLEGTPEESWAECERHAENLRLLLGEPEVVAKNAGKVNSLSPQGKVEAEPDIEQLGFF